MFDKNWKVVCQLAETYDAYTKNTTRSEDHLDIAPQLFGVKFVYKSVLSIWIEFEFSYHEVLWSSSHYKIVR